MNKRQRTGKKNRIHLSGGKDGLEFAVAMWVTASHPDSLLLPTSNLIHFRM